VLSPPSRRREWLARALFEAALILFGLLAAFALNQWQEARQRAARADAMIGAIRAELAANLDLQSQAAAHNAEVVELLRKLRDAGETFLPSGQLKGALFSRPHLTEAAWASAQNGGILQELPIETILALAKIDETQRDYQDSVSTLYEGLYGVALNAAELRTDGYERVPRLAIVLNDFALNGTRLVREYRRALEYLDGAYELRATPRAATPAAADAPESTE
jgi:type II secretory pathway pseudopilin PulG